MEIVKIPKKMQILLFCLIPVGAIILLFPVRSLKRTFSGEIILEIPYTRKSSELIIMETGYYTIWHLGTAFTKAPLSEFRPEITERSTGSRIRLIPSLFRPNVTGFKTARMELFRFKAAAGNYTLNLVEGSSVSGIENTITELIPARKVDPGKYLIQVRKSQPRISVFISIFLIAISGFCIIGGLVLGVLAEQIFETK